jgi:GNAT superfamily N-acetyltransferase
MFIKKYADAFFVIIRRTRFDFRGRIHTVKGIELNGYDLDVNGYSNTKPFITLRCNACYDDNYDCLRYLFIQDFNSCKSTRDKGFGSMVLQQFIEYAKSLDVEYVRGEMSFIDIGTEEGRTEEQAKNRARLYHFYPKHGFEIDGNGAVVLKLK